MRASQPAGRAPSQPATAALVRSATTSSSRPPSRSASPVTYRVGATRVALRKLVSSSPSAATRSRRAGSSAAAGHGHHRPHDGRPADPESRHHPRPRGRRLPTRRQASAGPLGQHRPRGDPATARSRSAPCRPARQRRSLAPPGTTGRPPIGRSRTHTTRRPCGVARRGPHQPTIVAVVWTTNCHSPPTSSAETISKPSRSSSEPGRTALVTHLGPSASTSDIRKICEAPGVCSPTASLAAPHHASRRRAR